MLRAARRWRTSKGGSWAGRRERELPADRLGGGTPCKAARARGLHLHRGISLKLRNGLGGGSCLGKSTGGTMFVTFFLGVINWFRREPEIMAFGVYIWRIRSRHMGMNKNYIKILTKSQTCTKELNQTLMLMYMVNTKIHSWILYMLLSVHCMYIHIPMNTHKIIKETQVHCDTHTPPHTHTS